MASKGEDLRDMLRTMIIIRAFELKVAELFAAGKLPGSVHSYVGQEAIRFAEASPFPAPEETLEDVCSP